MLPERAAVDTLAGSLEPPAPETAGTCRAPLSRHSIAQQPVDNFRLLESFRDDSLLPSRVTATVVGLFSVLALVITATGIAGVVGYRRAAAAA